MKKIRLGIIGAADIAYNRFLPALSMSSDFEYVGVATRSGNNGIKMQEEFGGVLLNSYEEILSNPNIDAIYLPLPPALHFEWAMKAVQNGKNVFLEKPFTTSVLETKKLIACAKKKDVAIFENYAFVFHNQMKVINDLIKNQEIGEIRHIDIKFGFPKRAENDFRYNKQLGGGALLDCGGYTVKLASLLLGNSCKVISSCLHQEKQSGVDMYGSATMMNEQGQTANIAFGMDNEYQCSLELWGSKGTLMTPRIFTAPDGFSTVIYIKKSGVEERIEVPSFNQFYRVIQFFKECINNADKRADSYSKIEIQSILVDKVIKVNNVGK